MDKLAQEWQGRFETIWDPHGQGKYRLGSPGQRLVKRFLANMDTKAAINEYGSGTGRAVVEMIKTPGQCQHPIHMVDIATNAMEVECQALLDNGQYALTFTHAPLWQLPADFPRAEWGYCVDVLMCVPPERLHDILGEIKRTCDNLFLQVYDWADVRCGIDLTTIKHDGAWWAEQLREYWTDVVQEVSPESSHRYIFVCRGDAATHTKNGTITDLRNRYYGQTAWIVGRGPSLLKVTKEHFGVGPVIALNESIQNIGSLGLPNKLFNIWRNGDPPADLLTCLPQGTTLLLCDNPVLKDPPSSTMFTNWLPRNTFECKRDLGCSPPATFSMKAALEIAVRVMGCTKVNFVSFDSCTTGDARTVLKSSFIRSEYRPGDYDEQCQIIAKRVKEMGIETTWVTPGEKDIVPWTGIAKCGEIVRINVGCGEVIEPGYTNIDLHHDLADVKMDTRALQYPDDSVDEIYSSHLLEHFGKREIPVVLREWYRVLKVGGTLKLNLPNLEWCLKNWLAKPEKERFGLALDMLFGHQAHEGEYHKTGFTRARLTALLTEAGFADITIEDRQSHEQMCFSVTAGKRKMNNGITVITLTGDRPLAFALCRRWLANQTQKPDQWIVVDDGRVPLSPTADMEYVRRDPRPDDPTHTMLLNLQAALPLVRGSKVLIMEDDEYYSPRFIAEMSRRLDEHEVVGIARSKYYHLPTGGFLRHTNMDHASLAQTGFRSSFLPEVIALAQGDMYLDIRIWKKVGNTDQLRWGENKDVAKERSVSGGRGLLFDDGDGGGEGCLYVGIKGLPGRPGIGVGHRHYKEYLPDTPTRDTLRRWIPGDDKYYRAILEGKLSNGNCLLDDIDLK